MSPQIETERFFDDVIANRDNRKEFFAAVYLIGAIREEKHLNLSYTSSSSLPVVQGKLKVLQRLLKLDQSEMGHVAFSRLLTGAWSHWSHVCKE